MEAQRKLLSLLEKPANKLIVTEHSELDWGDNSETDGGLTEMDLARHRLDVGSVKAGLGDTGSTCSGDRSV